MARIPRTNGQRFFLTYSQAAAVTIDEVADHVFNLAPCWLEIVQELHQDDGIHYHVVVEFAARFQHPLDIFDVDGLHPNICSIKNATVDLANRRHYIRKGAERAKEDEHTIKTHKTKACDYIIDPDTRGDVPEYVATSGRLNWGGILDAAGSADEFKQLVRINQPKEWVLRFDQIIKFAAVNYAKAVEPEKVYPAESWSIPPAMDDWVKEVFSDVS